MEYIWVKNKSTVLLCGICGECGRELLNTDSGWIITHSKKYFCHDGSLQKKTPCPRGKKKFDLEFLNDTRRDKIVNPTPFLP